MIHSISDLKFQDVHNMVMPSRSSLKEQNHKVHPFLLQTQVLFHTTTDQIATTWHTTLIGGKSHPGYTWLYRFHVVKKNTCVFECIPTGEESLHPSVDV